MRQSGRRERATARTADLADFRRGIQTCLHAVRIRLANSSIRAPCCDLFDRTVAHNVAIRIADVHRRVRLRHLPHFSISQCEDRKDRWLTGVRFHPKGRSHCCRHSRRPLGPLRQDAVVLVATGRHEDRRRTDQPFSRGSRRRLATMSRHIRLHQA